MASRSITIFKHQFQYQAWGDSAIRFWVSNSNSAHSAAVIAEAILHDKLKHIDDIISTDREMLIITDSTIKLMRVLSQVSDSSLAKRVARKYLLPVFLNPEEGPLAEIDQKLLEDKLKASPFQLSMYGFIPGFMYFSGLDQELHLARKTNPTTNCQAGSVAIGGRYLGIYNFSSPAGWHIIGQTPVKIPLANKNICIADKLELKFIDEPTYLTLKEKNIDIITYNAQY